MAGWSDASEFKGFSNAERKALADSLPPRATDAQRDSYLTVAGSLIGQQYVRRADPDNLDNGVLRRRAEQLHAAAAALVKELSAPGADTVTQPMNGDELKWLKQLANRAQGATEDTVEALAQDGRSPAAGSMLVYRLGRRWTATFGVRPGVSPDSRFVRFLVTLADFRPDLDIPRHHSALKPLIRTVR